MWLLGVRVARRPQNRWLGPGRTAAPHPPHWAQGNPSAQLECVARPGSRSAKTAPTPVGGGGGWGAELWHCTVGASGPLDGAGTADEDPCELEGAGDGSQAERLQSQAEREQQREHGLRGLHQAGVERGHVLKRQNERRLRDRDAAQPGA